VDRTGSLPRRRPFLPPGRCAGQFHCCKTQAGLWNGARTWAALYNSNRTDRPHFDSIQAGPFSLWLVLCVPPRKRRRVCGSKDHFGVVVQSRCPSPRCCPHLGSPVWFIICQSAELAVPQARAILANASTLAASTVAVAKMQRTNPCAKNSLLKTKGPNPPRDWGPPPHCADEDSVRSFRQCCQSD
jgi:hypothetical protein